MPAPTSTRLRRDTPLARERAERILDAAAELLLRWGYQRITMEDIAQHAHIGTGTLYLHWPSKAALFETVMVRELGALWAALEQALRIDARTAALSQLLTTLLRLLHARPLAHALFIRDRAVLGALADRPAFASGGPVAGADALIGLLRDLRLMRRDGDGMVQAHALSAIWTGFVLLDSVTPAEQTVALDIQLAALAMTIEHTFAPDEPPSLAALETTIAPALADFLAGIRAATEQHRERHARDTSARHE